MQARTKVTERTKRVFWATAFALVFAASSRGESATGEVRGRVSMPETCAPGVSPAVAIVEPLDKTEIASTPAPGQATVRMDQKSLRFNPRVRALKPGQVLRVLNGDTETHSVHILSPKGRTVLSRSASPGTPIEFRPEKPGIYQIVCDIHSHMRAFVVVGKTPWIKTCSSNGSFRFDDLPAGRYALSVWHELGPGLRREREFEVKAGQTVDLGEIAVKAREISGRVLAGGTVRPWADVIDQIGMLLAGATESAKASNGYKQARKSAQDAYFVEFETSGMETAVAQVLGEERRVELEELFRDFYGPEIRAIADGKSSGAESSRKLLLALSRAGGDLDRQGIPDIAHLSIDPGSTLATPGLSDHAGNLVELGRAFDSARELADRGEADDAAAYLGDVYFHQFEPIERELRARNLSTALRLESRYLNLRGRVGAGLKGPELASAFQSFRQDVDGSLARLQGTSSSGAFGAAFGASLGILVREGAEVILILGMLLAIVSKSVAPEARRKARTAIGQGVALAILASALTAVALNRLVFSTQGRARELLEGFVLLSAAGVLFYVSYWLISQVESKRWTDFLKAQARKGSEVGGFATLGLAAFLAVFREGAETALMYQAQIALFGHARSGRLGLFCGIGVGLVILAVVYVLIRMVGAKLPLRLFFKGTGVLLFGMAVVFAGKAVFELQSSGLIKITPLLWLGDGLPSLGVYPNAQGLAVQGLLLAGALAALVVLGIGSSANKANVGSKSRAAVLN